MGCYGDFHTFEIHDLRQCSLLLHTETSEGSVIPVWEQVQPENVKVVKDIMASRKYIQDVELDHRRIPITSELPPDFSDFAEYGMVYFLDDSLAYAYLDYSTLLSAPEQIGPL